MEPPEPSGDRIAAFFERDRFARENGMRVVEVRRGFARTEMSVEPHHLNAVGILEGGALRQADGHGGRDGAHQQALHVPHPRHGRSRRPGGSLQGPSLHQRHAAGSVARLAAGADERT